jgi:RND family efflux transporter MFP subunit
VSKGSLIAVLVIPVLLVGTFSAYELNLYPGGNSASILSILPSFLNPSSVEVTRGDITKEIRFTGEIIDAAEVDVYFETEGKVDQILVSAGDIVNKNDLLATIEADSLLYRFKSAEAQLKAAESRLRASQRGTRSEEISVKTANVERYESQIESFEQILSEEYQNAFAVAQTAIFSQTDQLYNDPRKSNRRLIAASIGNYEPEEDRADIGDKLQHWQDETFESSSFSILHLAENARLNLTAIRNYLNMLSYIFNHHDNYNVTRSTLIADALESVNGSLLSLSRALENYGSAVSARAVAQQELNLARAGVRGETIDNDRAMVDYYQSQYEELKHEYEKTLLRSPVGGAIAKRNLEIGELTSGDAPVFTIIGTGTPYTIGAHVSELTIADITLDAQVHITLDALPAVSTLAGEVTDIELTDTKINNVPSYKVTLSFSSIVPPEIRPGMTTNVTLSTTKSGTLSIPLSAVNVRGTETFVQVIERGSSQERLVTLGMYGGDGLIEVLSGLSEGDWILTNEP